jgi:hypothetical protein
MPVLAIQPAGKGRAAVFTGDTTRNWEQGPRVLGQDTPFLRFWGQMVRWLAGRDDPLSLEAGVEARTDRAYYEPDSTVTIHAVVRDAQGQGASNAQVRAIITGPAQPPPPVDLPPAAGPPGQFTGSFQPDQVGTIQIRVEATLEAQILAAEPLTIEVGRPNLEFDHLELDDQRLARIAQASGGRYAHVSAAQDLLAQLDRAAHRRRVSLEQPLYAPGPFWLLFAAILTTEWILRRRFQLR